MVAQAGHAEGEVARRGGLLEYLGHGRLGPGYRLRMRHALLSHGSPSRANKGTAPLAKPFSRIKFDTHKEAPAPRIPRKPALLLTWMTERAAALLEKPAQETRVYALVGLGFAFLKARFFTMVKTRQNTNPAPESTQQAVSTTT